MTKPGLPAVYQAYIAQLNAHRMRDLEAHVADRLAYNGAALTRADYEDMLVGDVAVFPDLHFDVRQVVVEGEHLAARIHFACTPVLAWRGRDPDGRPVRFDEHVFYRFVGGRIAEVHSLISPPEAVGQPNSS